MPGALAATTEHIPATAAEVQVKDGSPNAAARPASLLVQTLSLPSIGQEHVHARGLLAMISEHISDAAAETQLKPSPKIFTTSASSSLHCPVAEAGRPPSSAPAEVMDDVSTRHVASSTRLFRLETSTPFSPASMLWQLS